MGRIGGMQVMQWRETGWTTRPMMLVVVLLLLVSLLSNAREIVVTSTADSGNGTLRWAIETGLSGDVITFDPEAFPSNDPATIHVRSVLPSLQQGNLTIDASDAGVILDGQGSSEPNTWGLEIISDGNVVRGLQIVNFTGFGIQIVGGAQHNVIGGDRDTGAGPTGQGNLSSGNNGGIGLYDEGTSYNTITGNLIGTDVTGTEAFGNIDGMFLSGGASHNTIGSDNVIAYNREHAIVVQGSSSLGNAITENSIHSNEWGGIQLIEGGNNELAPPLITSFDRTTKVLSGSTCPNCAVEIFSDGGNQGKHLEGQTPADETGAFRFVVEKAPVDQFLTATATSSTGDTSGFSLTLSCAGLAAAAGHQLLVTSTADDGDGTLRWALETAQPGDAITFDTAIFPPQDPTMIYPQTEFPPMTCGSVTIDASNAGIVIDGSDVPGDWNNGLQVYSSDNTIMGLQIVNFAGSGIVVAQGTSNTVGGSRSSGLGPIGEGNLTSGNGIGVNLCDVGTSENTILGNLVGVDVDGTTPWGNEAFGILFEDNVHDNVIGPANVIANNTQGIAITGVGAIRNRITQNSIYGNSEFGIQLSGGANGHLPAPVLIDFELNSGVIEGSACPSCRIEFFSDHGAEGEYFEGLTEADSAGHFLLQESSAFLGPYLTAVAIDADGNSSCFSNPAILVSSVLPVASGRGIIVNSTADSGDGTLRWALETAQAGDAITFDPAIFPPDEPATIPLRSELPPIDQGGIMMDASDAGVVLDGAGLSSDEAGIVLTSAGNSLKGLEFIDFQGVAIRIRGSGFSNLIGGDSAIGTGPSGQGNVIRSCGTGILIDGEQAGQNVITGNFLGTASTGRGSFGNEYGVVIAGGRGHNEIGPNNVIAYSGEADVEIRDSARNTIGPENTIIQNFLPAIRIIGEASSGNIITRNTLRTTGIVRGYYPQEGSQCLEPPGCVRYSGAFDIDEASQGGIQIPRITALNTSEGAISGTTCPGCLIEVFSGGRFVPYIYEGCTTADEEGQFDFAKGSALVERGIFITATDPERGTSALRAPLCRSSVSPVPSSEGEVRIMTYNVMSMPEKLFDWQGLAPDEWEDASPQWSDFIELIEFASPDILALQEMGWAAEGGRVLHAFAERLGYPYFVSESELAVFSRYEIINSGEPYGCAEILLPNGQSLRVVSVHIGNCDRVPEELQWLLGAIGPLINVPAVVLGDFNANLDSQFLHSECFDALPDQGWRLVADNWSAGPQPLDSIWVSPMLVPYAREWQLATLCSANSGYEISDHDPVMMILTVPWSE